MIHASFLCDIWLKKINPDSQRILHIHIIGATMRHKVNLIFGKVAERKVIANV